MGGDHLIPLAHVQNTAEATYLAGVVENIQGEVFNIVDDNLPTQREFMKLYKKYLGRINRSIWIPDWFFGLIVKTFEFATKLTKGNIPPVVTKYRAENLWKPLKYDNSLAKNKLGWTPGISPDEGLKEMFQSVKE